MEELELLRIVEVGDHAALAGVQVVEHAALLGVGLATGERAHRPGGVPPRRLQLDYLCAEVGEEAGAERGRDGRAQLHDPEIIERLHAHLPAFDGSSTVISPSVVF